MFGGSKRNRATQAPEGVKTEFVYADGAKDDVQLSGDWNDWKAIQMFHEGGGMWSVVTPVPPGPHEFKYIVDGEWKHSLRHPTIGIDNVSLNNVRYVLPQPDIALSSDAKTPSTAAAARSTNAGKPAPRTPRASITRESRATRARKSMGSLFSNSKSSKSSTHS